MGIDRLAIGASLVAVRPECGPDKSPAEWSLTMARRFWYKSMVLLATGVTLGLGLGDGCLNAVVQRILVAVTFD